MRREIADRRLTEGSSFADSSELTSKTAALFSLMAEAVLDLAPPDTRRILSAGDSPFYEDTVLRRGIEVAFERLRRGQEPFDPDSALLRSRTVRPPSPTSDRADSRFFTINAAGRHIRVLRSLNEEDDWTASFLKQFQGALTEPDSRYGIIPATEAEVTTTRQALSLLARTLPRTYHSALSHLSFIAVAAGPDVFESASDRKRYRARSSSTTRHLPTPPGPPRQCCTSVSIKSSTTSRPPMPYTVLGTTYPRRSWYAPRGTTVLPGVSTARSRPHTFMST